MSLLSTNVPGSERVTDRCPYHGTDSSFERFFRARLTPNWLKLPLGPGRSELGEHSEVWAFRCLYCEKTVLVRHALAASDDYGDNTAIESSMLVPDANSPRMASEVPGEIASLWEEAAVCANAGAMRGAAGCLRGAVEQIAKERGAQGGDIKTRIDDLGSKTNLDADIIKALHDTRLTGNWSLHDGVTFSRDEIDDLSQLIEETVEVLYVQPAKRAAMAAARTQRRGGRAP